MICSNCGTDNPNGAAFCGSCGASLQGAQQPAFNQQYGNPGYVMMEEPGKNKATASLICSIISMFCCSLLGIAGIVCGLMAKKEGYKGGMATAGIIVGGVSIGLWLLGIIFYIIVMVATASSGYYYY